MRVIKHKIVHDSLRDEYRNMQDMSDELWKKLITGLWDQVERGMALNHSTWKCNHAHWENWIGMVQ